MSSRRETGRRRPYGNPRGSLERPRAQSEPRESVLIVTEGRCTEPNYFKALRNRLKLTLLEVVHPDATDPVTLVDEAVRLRDERARNAKRGNGVRYDEVWVCFDLEHTHDERRGLARRARERARAKKIKVAESDPCFEYWVFLHFAYSTAPADGCALYEGRVREQVPAYTKSYAFTDSDLSRVPDAVERARQCRKHREETGAVTPSTDVDHLVLVLNDNASESLRFRLQDGESADPG